MCKKSVRIDGLDSSLGEEGADARFGRFVTHSKQDMSYNASLLLSKGARRLEFTSFSVLFFCLTKSFNTCFKNSH